MAGLGFKDFQVGEVLTSSDVDGYLMQQSVMRFADSGARGSALGTAAGTGVALSEGMVAYLDDVPGRGAAQFYDGSGWKTLSGVLQIVTTTKTNTFSSTSGTYTDVTGLTVTITPSSTSSKVLLIAQVGWSTSSGNADNIHFRFNGGNADDYVGAAAGSRIRGVFGGRAETSAGVYDPGWTIHSYSMVYVDSPATTSATTYAVQMEVNQGTGYVNRAGQEIDNNTFTRGASSITAIEVPA